MFTWIKRNKLATLLLLVIIGNWLTSSLLRSYLGLNLQSSPTVSGRIGGSSGAFGGIGGIAAPAMEKMISDSIYPVPESPPTDAADRLVIQSSEVSLLVKDVVDSRNKIITYAKDNGGYMVNSTTSNPQDAPTSTVTVRIDSTKLQAALDYFHELSVKVVSENLSGYDVTDQYVDVEKRIAILEQTKAKFNEILSTAREVSDIVNLNQQIISIQSQIDSYKGQQEALKQNAKLARLTVYLSTDEIALPYAPSETFRPGVIFKLAVRSLVGHLRELGTILIWVGVYALVWVPALLIARFVYKRYKGKLS